jgi:hypothetical protein
MEAVVIHWPISCIALLQTDDICVKKNNMFVRRICVGMKIHFVVINGVDLYKIYLICNYDNFTRINNGNGLHVSEMY